MFVTGSSATPCTIRTGRDDNGGAIFNDRPAGVSRNSERGAAQWTVNANVAHGRPTLVANPPEDRYRDRFSVLIQGHG